MSNRPVTWTCHVCGKRRPDRKISVRSTAMTFPGGMSAQQNVRYCNDDPVCAEKSKTFSFFEGTN